MQPDRESVLLNGRNSSTDTSNKELIAAQGAGVRIYVTTLVISNSSASNTEVDIKDGTTILMTVPAPSTGGAIIDMGESPLKLSANTALNYASVAGVTTMKVSAVGYKGV